MCFVTERSEKIVKRKLRSSHGLIIFSYLKIQLKYLKKIITFSTRSTFKDLLFRPNLYLLWTHFSLISFHPHTFPEISRATPPLFYRKFNYYLHLSCSAGTVKKYNPKKTEITTFLSFCIHASPQRRFYIQLVGFLPSRLFSFNFIEYFLIAFSHGLFWLCF